MADASFDVVIIGGGHNGMAVGLYLASNGMTVGVFEKKNELGGGCDTQEMAAPGFWGDTHSAFHQHLMGPPGLMPVYADFELDKYGVRYIQPDILSSVVLPDETCHVSYNPSVPGGAEKNLESLSRFSERDVEMLMRVGMCRLPEYHDLFMQYFYNPPTLPGEPNPLKRACEAIGISEEDYYYYCSMSTYELSCELFESTAQRYSLLEASWSFSNPPDADGLGLPSVFGMLLNNPMICEGGSHNLAHGLQRALHDLGGKCFTQSEVEKVLIENGRATGVRLVDGSEIRANKLVVSNADPAQTMLRMVGREHLSAQMIRRLEKLRSGDDAIFWPQFALHEPPKYSAAAFNPDVNRSWLQFLVGEDYEKEILYARWEQRLGRVPRITPLVWCDSHWDATAAPRGKYEAGGQSHAPKISALSEREWLELKRELPDQWIKTWQRYAPNMTWDNFIGFNMWTPYDYGTRTSMPEGCLVQVSVLPHQHYHFRPIPELARYRAPIKDLYLCSNAMPPVPMGAINATGYCCYKILVEDYGLDKIWEKKGRSY